MTDLPAPGDAGGDEALNLQVRRALGQLGLDTSDPATRAAIVAAVSEPRIDRRLSAAEKQRYALELRASGATYEEVARLVGWKSVGSAHKAVMKALKDMRREPVEELRTLELARLDAMLAGGLYTRARRGDVGAIDRVLRIMETRRRYVPDLEVESKSGGLPGADQPLIVELSIPSPDMTAVAVPEHELAERGAGVIDARATAVEGGGGGDGGR